MELEMMYPEIIAYALIASFVLLLVWRGKKKFKKGVMVANTKYIKKTSIYKRMLVKYHFYNILIKATCILLIFVCAVLTTRINRTDRFEEEFNNRDIMLCMDVSGSVQSLNKDIIETLKETVKTLKDERFGISVFDGVPLSLVPLTTDYNYALDILDQISEALNYTYSSSNNRFIRDFLTAGTQNYTRGSSLVGEGLAYCAASFKKNDDRTKIIILTTDNEVYGDQLVTVPEASSYARANGIKVYPIGTKTIGPTERIELVDVANNTGGVYYDFSSFSTDAIAEKINQLNKSAIIKNVYVRKKDMPEIIFPYMLYIVAILFVLDWRVRI